MAEDVKVPLRSMNESRSSLNVKGRLRRTESLIGMILLTLSLRSYRINLACAAMLKARGSLFPQQPITQRMLF